MYILFFLIQSVFALETDNYVTWKRELSDSSEIINEILKEQILIAASEETNQDCRSLMEAVSNKFKAFLVHGNPLENWLKEKLTAEQIYPKDRSYLNESIYRNPLRFYTPLFSLSPNLQVSGIYFGTDKLTHFSSTGRRYFEHYSKKIKSGKSPTEALDSAIRFGLQNEAGPLGIWSSGVFSYADVEANYQGFLFYQNICMSKNSYMISRNGNWKMIRRPDIRLFVNPDWDETHNRSYYSKENWKKISAVLRSEYCPLMKTNLVLKRSEHYRKNYVESYSMKFIRTLQSSGANLAPKAPEFSCAKD